MKELIIRSIFGLIFLAIVFVPLSLDLIYGFHTLNIVLLIFALIGIQELYRMAGKTRASQPNPLPGMLAVILLFSPMIYTSFGDFFSGNALVITHHTRLTIRALMALLMLGSFTYFILLIFAKFPIQSIFKSPLLLSIFYPALPLALLAFVWTFNNNDSRELLIFVLLPIYLNDSLAYVTGRFLGKNKLIPSVSPKKTWEGFIGGMLGALVVMHLIFFFTNNYALMSPAIVTIICILASVLATLGDLFESKLKRSAEVKDSGNILPGHGGILDRIDAMLFVAPVLYVLLTFIL
jgi:phosphatidate cytidylyltransferase